MSKRNEPSGNQTVEKTRCSRCERQATLFVARELGTVSRVRFLAHLQSCEKCALAVRELREVQMALQALPQHDLSTATRHRLSSSAQPLLPDAPSRRSRLRLAFRFAVVTATMATAIVIAVLYRPLPDPDPVPDALTELAPDAALLKWDPGSRDLVHLAVAIRNLRRRPSTPPANLSKPNHDLMRARKRMRRLQKQSL